MAPMSSIPFEARQGKNQMTKVAMLDNVTHKDLKVKMGYSAEYGDNINLALIFPTEYAFIQREYPILFRKNSKGDFESVALLGLDKGENLFLADSNWNARYIPAIQQRGPFVIGLHGKNGQASAGQEPMVHIDLDHPRVSETEGAPLFLRHGGNSPFLDHASRMLQMIYLGTEMTKPMFSAFEDADLLEPMDVEVAVNEQVKYTIPDFFTINQDNLAKLSGSELESLNRHGFLHLAMMVASSLGNLSWLVELKNRKLASAQA